MRLPIALAALLLALLGLAPSAHASSILYVKGNDLWLSTPDGARKAQVTHAGSYAWPSQADDGTIVAMDEATRVVRLDRAGHPVGEPFPFSIRPGNPFGLAGPWSPSVSPNGRLIAFGYDVTSTTCQPKCTPESASGTAYTYADRFTELQALGDFRGATEPSWVDDATTLTFAPGTEAPVRWNTVGAQPEPWFSDPELPYTNYGVLDRRKEKLAVGVGLGRSTALVLYSVTSAPPAPQGDPPVSRCQVSSDDGSAIPRASWAPDGSALAFELKDAVYVLPVGNIFATRGCAAVGVSVKLDDGLMPAWGPADVPAAATPIQTPQPVPAPAPVTPAPAATPPRPTLTITGRPTLASALRKGLTVRVGAPTSTRVTVTGKLAAKTAKRLHLPRTIARGAGTTTIHVRFSAAARTRLRRVRTLDITLSGAGAERTIRLR